MFAAFLGCLIACTLTLRGWTGGPNIISCKVEAVLLSAFSACPSMVPHFSVGDFLPVEGVGLRVGLFECLHIASVYGHVTLAPERCSSCYCRSGMVHSWISLRPCGEPRSCGCSQWRHLVGRCGLHMRPKGLGAIWFVLVH